MMLKINYSIKNHFGEGTVKITWVGWTFNALIILGWILDIAIFFVILFFFKFHIELVLKNTTTLENLDRRRQTTAQNSTAHAGSNVIFFF